MSQQLHLFPDSSFSFGPRFLHDHAGRIITDPRIALVELVANSYDAGASLIKIQWPDNIGGIFQVEDNGTGMTMDEFNKRWRTLSYSRVLEQGPYVEYPPDVKGTKRIAFGQNGKGRYSPFCFADAYEVETWKNGNSIVARVELTQGGIEPFHCEIITEGTRKGHGTCIRAAIDRNQISVASVSEAIGSKFLVDPFFSVFINEIKLELFSLSGIASTSLQLDPYGTVVIHQIDAQMQDRTMFLRGITWWVNKRMVGISPSWDGLDGRGAILDGRTALAKRCSFIVEVDFLKEDVKDDWTGFRDTPRVLAVRDTVRNYVIEALNKLLAENRRERKLEALAQNREVLGRLPTLSKRLVGQFIDEVQQSCPTLSQGDLERAVTIFTKMEAARSGYELLEKLAACSPDDLDTWNKLMEEWTASNAEIILSELKRRLDLIQRMQQLVNVATTDELHELQPLFARGLWIFGPEYESVEFTSNRAMATIINNYLGGTSNSLSNRRPDIVALPDRSICCYTADKFDDNGEVDGIRKVLIVELKKGGFILRTTELRQGEDYAQELQKANLVTKSTEIIVYVLGARLSDDATEERTIGSSIKIIPMTYDTILKRAHARTFNLQRKLQIIEPAPTHDRDVEDIISVPLFKSVTIDKAMT
ncbi:MAG: ATP-binding protein [Patescibacteria group bacterium]